MSIFVVYKYVILMIPMRRMLTTIALIPYQKRQNQKEYVFVYNTNCKTNHDIIDKLNNFSMATTSIWVNVNPLFIKKPSDQNTTMTSRCYDCPKRMK
jgi:hypothetical protein